MIITTSWTTIVNPSNSAEYKEKVDSCVNSVMLIKYETLKLDRQVNNITSSSSYASVLAGCNNAEVKSPVDKCVNSKVIAHPNKETPLQRDVSVKKSKQSSTLVHDGTTQEYGNKYPSLVKKGGSQAVKAKKSGEKKLLCWQHKG